MQALSRRWVWVLTAVWVLAVSVPGAVAEKDQSSAENVAMVNGLAISRADFDMEMKRFQRRMMAGHMPGSESGHMEVRDKVLENLIDLELLYQDSQKKDVKVDEGLLEKRLTTIKGQFPDEAKFHEALGKEGLSEEILRSQLERELAIEALIEKQVVQKTAVSDQETKAYYDENPDLFNHPEQVRASHILITVDPNADDAEKAEARKKIDDIKKKLADGGDFAELAKEFSQCPSSAKGGDLDYFGRGQMVKPFEEAVFALEPGQVSDVVETKFGYHLIKLTDRKPEGTISYENVKDRLERFLKQRKIQDGISEYLQSLKKEAKIERFLAETPPETP